MATSSLAFWVDRLVLAQPLHAEVALQFLDFPLLTLPATQEPQRVRSNDAIDRAPDVVVIRRGKQCLLDDADTLYLAQKVPSSVLLLDANDHSVLAACAVHLPLVHVAAETSLDHPPATAVVLRDAAHQPVACVELRAFLQVPCMCSTPPHEHSAHEEPVARNPPTQQPQQPPAQQLQQQLWQQQPQVQQHQPEQPAQHPQRCSPAVRPKASGGRNGSRSPQRSSTRVQATAAAAAAVAAVAAAASRFRQQQQQQQDQQQHTSFMKQPVQRSSCAGDASDARLRQRAAQSRSSNSSSRDSGGGCSSYPQADQNLGGAPSIPTPLPAPAPAAPAAAAASGGQVADCSAVPEATAVVLSSAGTAGCALARQDQDQQQGVAIAPAACQQCATTISVAAQLLQLSSSTAARPCCCCHHATSATGSQHTPATASGSVPLHTQGVSAATSMVWELMTLMSVRAVMSQAVDGLVMGTRLTLQQAVASSLPSGCFPPGWPAAAGGTGLAANAAGAAAAASTGPSGGPPAEQTVRPDAAAAQCVGTAPQHQEGQPQPWGAPPAQQPAVDEEQPETTARLLAAQVEELNRGFAELEGLIVVRDEASSSSSSSGTSSSRGSAGSHDELQQRSARVSSDDAAADSSSPAQPQLAAGAAAGGSSSIKRTPSALPPHLPPLASAGSASLPGTAPGSQWQVLARSVSSRPTSPRFPSARPSAANAALDILQSLCRPSLRAAPSGASEALEDDFEDLDSAAAAAPQAGLTHRAIGLVGSASSSIQAPATGSSFGQRASSVSGRPASLPPLSAHALSAVGSSALRGASGAFAAAALSVQPEGSECSAIEEVASEDSSSSNSSRQPAQPLPVAPRRGLMAAALPPNVRLASIAPQLAIAAPAVVPVAASASISSFASASSSEAPAAGRRASQSLGAAAAARPSEGLAARRLSSFCLSDDDSLFLENNLAAAARGALVAAAAGACQMMVPAASNSSISLGDSDSASMESIDYDELAASLGLDLDIQPAGAVPTPDGRPSTRHGPSGRQPGTRSVLPWAGA